MNRADLLTNIDNGRAELEAALAAIDRNRLTEPLMPNGWSVKDVIGHIGFWEGRIAKLYDILLRGEEPVDTVTNETVDALNLRIHAENQMIPLGIMELNEQEAYRALRRVAETASDPDLFDPHRFDWTQGTPFYQFIVENTYGHYDDHLVDLRAVGGQG